jgi:hypothetical protein
MRLGWRAITLLLTLVAAARSGMPETPSIPGGILEQIWTEGRDRSQLHGIAQDILDSIGSRLTGCPEQKRANDWATSVYQTRHRRPCRAMGHMARLHRDTLHVDPIGFVQDRARPASSGDRRELNLFEIRLHAAASLAT